MRIAYVNADPGVPAFGTKGCSVHVQEIIRAMIEAGGEVELFTRRLDGVAPTDLSKVRVHTLSRLSRENASEREQAAVGGNDEIEEQLMLGTYDLVYERSSLWSYSGMGFARRHGIPGVLEVNAPLIEEQMAYRGLENRALAEEIAHRAFSAASVILAVSDEVAAYVKGFGETIGKVVVLPNAINPSRFAEEPAPAMAASDLFTIGFVGTLKPWHGLMVLAEAFEVFRQRHGASRLLIVGDGTERTKLEEHFRARGVDRDLVFTGAVRPEQVPSFLASMDVAVAPYPNLANFYFSPLKIYEYMAAGLPVVASRIGQIANLIEHGVTGWLVNPGDVMALAEGLEVLGGRPELRKRMGEAARRCVLQNHTWCQRVREIFDLAFETAKAADTPRR